MPEGQWAIVGENMCPTSLIPVIIGAVKNLLTHSA